MLVDREGVAVSKTLRVVLELQVKDMPVVAAHILVQIIQAVAAAELAVLERMLLDQRPAMVALPLLAQLLDHLLVMLAVVAVVVGVLLELRELVGAMVVIMPMVQTELPIVAAVVVELVLMVRELAVMAGPALLFFLYLLQVIPEQQPEVQQLQLPGLTLFFNLQAPAHTRHKELIWEKHEI
jgi:hypothetical protein